MSAEDWAQGEIIRTVVALTNAVEKLDAKIDALGDSFVPREVFDLHMRVLEDAVKRVEATENQLSEMARTMVSKKAVGALMTGISLFMGGAGAILAVVLH